MTSGLATALAGGSGCECVDRDFVFCEGCAEQGKVSRSARWTK
ncbi:MAG: hypothetical protein AAF799_25530 [Myxococcota bacterium]